MNIKGTQTDHNEHNNPNNAFGKGYKSLLYMIETHRQLQEFYSNRYPMFKAVYQTNIKKEQEVFDLVENLMKKEN